MTHVPTQAGLLSNMRRSQRVCLSVPIIVMKQATGKKPASEETRTLIVSAHGALLVMQLPIEAGELLTLRHTKTEEELSCRVVNVGPDQAGRREVGVEFEQPSPRFWRIAFPPADWSPRSADAKAPSVHSPTRRPLLKRNNSVSTQADEKQSDKLPGTLQS